MRIDDNNRVPVARHTQYISQSEKQLRWKCCELLCADGHISPQELTSNINRFVLVNTAISKLDMTAYEKLEYSKKLKARASNDIISLSRFDWLKNEERACFFVLIKWQQSVSRINITFPA